MHFLYGVDVLLFSSFLDSASLGLYPSAVSARVHSNMDIDIDISADRALYITTYYYPNHMRIRSSVGVV